MGTAAATATSPLAATVVRVRLRPSAARRLIATLLGTTHGIHVALPAAGPRSEGRLGPSARELGGPVALGIPRRAGHAPGGVLVVVAAPLVEASLRTQGNVGSGEGRSVPVARVTAPATGLLVGGVLPGRPRRAQAARLTSTRSPLSPAVAAGPKARTTTRRAAAFL